MVVRADADAVHLREQRDELARKLEKANNENLLLMQEIKKAEVEGPKSRKESSRK
jgi:hypothetical protein